MGFYKYKNAEKALDDIYGYQRAITILQERVNHATFNERRAVELLSVMAHCKVAHDLGDSAGASRFAKKIKSWVNAYAEDAKKMALYIEAQSNALGWCADNHVSKERLQKAIESGIDDGKKTALTWGYCHG